MRALFHDAVSDVEPHDGLADVRRRTRVRRTSASRRWAPILVGGGAVAATVVAATFVVTGLGDDDPTADRPPVASSPSSTSEGPTTSAAALYFLADTATGPRLYREFQAVTPTSDPAQKVLLRAAAAHAGVRATATTARSGRPSRSVRSGSRTTGSSSSSAPRPPSRDGSPAPVGSACSRRSTPPRPHFARALPVSFEWTARPAQQVLGLKVGTVVDRDRASPSPLRSTSPTRPRDCSSRTAP